MLKLINVWLAVVLLLACPLIASDSSNNGEDITRPVTRFDTRYKGQLGAGSQYGDDLIVTYRCDIAQIFKNWQYAMRIDIPFEAFYCPTSHAKSNCYKSKHMGDSLLQLFLGTPEYGKWTFGGGLKLIFPTGGKNLEIGDGKYQLIPSAAIKYNLDTISKGSFIGLILRYAWSVAGYSSAPAIRQTFVQPCFNLNLPCGWFLNSSPEMIFNWLDEDWFVPFDLMIGKIFNQKMVISLEYSVALNNDYPQYQNQLEFRVGIFF